MLRGARLAVLGAIALAGRAAAQNADGVLLGTEAALTGGAVLSTSHDAVGAYYNPAGLGALSGSTLQVSGSAYKLSSLRLRGFVSTSLPWTRVEETVRSTDWSSVPSVAVYGFRLSPRVGLALGLWVPARESVALVSTLHSAGPYAVGGATRVDYTQQIAITQHLERTYLGAAAGVELRPGLRLGSSLFLVHQRYEQFLDGVFALLTDSPDPAERGATASLSTRGAPLQIAARFGAGVQWDPSPSLSVAAAAKSPSVALWTSGSVTTVTASASLLPGGSPSVAFSQAAASPSRIAEPWRLAAGCALALGRASLRAEVDWQAPGERSHGVLNGRLGLQSEASEDLRWGMGLFTDRTREGGTSGSLAVDFYGVAAGLDYRPPQVRAARGPAAAWDMRASLAVRYALGTGRVLRVESDPFSPEAAPSTSHATALAQALSINIGAMLQL
jgi:hypothetical protein